MSDWTLNSRGILALLIIIGIILILIVWKKGRNSEGTELSGVRHAWDYVVACRCSFSVRC